MFDDEEEEEEEEQDEGTSMVSDMENTMVQNTDNSSRQELEWEEPNVSDYCTGCLLILAYYLK